MKKCSFITLILFICLSPLSYLSQGSSFPIIYLDNKLLSNESYNVYVKEGCLLPFDYLQKKNNVLDQEIYIKIIIEESDNSKKTYPLKLSNQIIMAENVHIYSNIFKCEKWMRREYLRRLKFFGNLIVIEWEDGTKYLYFAKVESAIFCENSN